MFLFGDHEAAGLRRSPNGSIAPIITAWNYSDYMCNRSSDLDGYIAKEKKCDFRLSKFSKLGNPLYPVEFYWSI